jgi:CRP-like cAMP-binding protein
MRKVTLSKGAVLWETGDTARTIAVLEKGTLGIRSGQGLVGVASARTVLGESAVFTVHGEDHKRSATLYSLTDDTAVTEYPAEMVKQAIDGNKDQVGPLILGTLVSQSCRNLLIVVTAQRNRSMVELPLKALMQSLIEQGRALKGVGSWEDFFTSFRFLYELRGYSEGLRESLVSKKARAEASVKASEVVKDLFKGAKDVAEYLEDLMREERETEQWLERSRPGVG